MLIDYILYYTSHRIILYWKLYIGFHYFYIRTSHVHVNGNAFGVYYDDNAIIII